jgi:inorganic pyrophosphatase
MFGFRSALGTVLAIGLAVATPQPVLGAAADGWTARDEYTLVATGDPVSEVPSRNPDGSVNALVEIPAGTNAKWELREEDGALAWDFESGRPRVVEYLAYPANYGMIPRTRIAADEGGDGDALDVIILGPARERGALVRVRIVGVLRLRDGGERDDKLLAVTGDSPFEEVRDLADLDTRFPGVTKIVEIWFSSYKGPGVLETRGFGGANEANAILESAEKSYASR